MKKNILKIICLSVLIVFSLGLLAHPISAQSNYEKKLEIFAQDANIVVNNNPEGMIPNIINWALSLIGLMFLIIILVAGFKYMTANGDSEKTKDALKAIQNGAIGVAIVLLAAVFVNFVLGQILGIFK